MDKKPLSLDDIFADDDLGLLDVKEKNPVVTEDDRLVSSFEEIVEFCRQHKRKPKEGGSIKETTLFYRLKGIRENEEKASLLIKYDTENLLTDSKFIQSEPAKNIESFSDILKDDVMGILNDDVDDIFVLKNVPAKQTTMPEYKARQRRCEDFAKFDTLLKSCQSDLKSGKRKLIPFRNEQDIQKGFFFILRGVLVYVAEMGDRFIEDGRPNARLRVIYENGTESDLLLRSLSAALYKNGRRVTEHEDTAFIDITEEDKEAGYIYVLKSHSSNPEISTISNLYKIGFTKNEVKQRIKNAENEPTFLMAPVSIVTTFKCYNLNPNKLEQLLHRFFGSACLDISIADENGLMHQPREWFIAPLEVIEQVVGLIQNQQIINYEYDIRNKEIILRATI